MSRRSRRRARRNTVVAVHPPNAKTVEDEPVSANESHERMAEAAEVSGATLYQSACTLRRHGGWAALGEKDRQTARDTLVRAIGLADCPVEAFLALDAVLEPEQSGSAPTRQSTVLNDIGHPLQRIDVLRRGLERYGDHAALLVRLATIYTKTLKSYGEAYDVLAKLNGQEELTFEQRYHAAELLAECGAQNEALSWLGTLATHLADPNDWLLLCADRLVEYGRPQEAFDRVAPLLQLSDPTHRIISRFIGAAAELSMDHVSRAMMLVGSAIDYLFALDALFDPCRPRLTVSNAARYSVRICSVELVCAAFAEGKGAGKIKGERLGRLHWLLYLARRSRIDAPSALRHLDEATRLAPDDRYFDFGPVFCAIDAQQYDRAIVFELNRVLADAVSRKEHIVPLWRELLSVLQLESLNETAQQYIDVGAARAAARFAGRPGSGQFFKDFYHHVWGPLHRNAKRWREAELAAVTSLKVAPKDPDLLFDVAYARHEQRKLAEAEAAYLQMLTIEENAGALNNLAVICEQTGRLAEAAAFMRRASAVRPEDENLTRAYASLTIAAEEEEREQDFYRSAPERWPKLSRQAQSLLCTVSLINGFDSVAHLADCAKMSSDWARHHFDKLVEFGMLVRSTDGRWQVNEHVKPLVARESKHAVAIKLVHADGADAYKLVFNSNAEYVFYKILLELFPNHLVFPNMSLQSIFQYDRMIELVDTDTFGYFLRSQVDFCITSTATYRPIIAFEADSHFHDDPAQQARDSKKEELFRVGGVPLLRLRQFGQPTTEAMRNDIIDAVAKCGQQLRTTSAGLAWQLEELDFDAFTATAS